MNIRWSRHLTAMGVALAMAAGSAASASSGDEIEVPDVVETCLSCHAIQPGEPELEGRRCGA